jgi:chromosome segregation ATPase
MGMSFETKEGKERALSELEDKLEEVEEEIWDLLKTKRGHELEGQSLNEDMKRKQEKRKKIEERIKKVKAAKIHDSPQVDDIDDSEEECHI